MPFFFLVSPPLLISSVFVTSDLRRPTQPSWPKPLALQLIVCRRNDLRKTYTRPPYVKNWASRQGSAAPPEPPRCIPSRQGLRLRGWCSSPPRIPSQD